MATRTQTRPIPRNVRMGEQTGVYLMHAVRARVDQFAQEMNWPRSRLINAVLALNVPESRQERAALADALIAADDASVAASHGR